MNLKLIKYLIVFLLLIFNTTSVLSQKQKTIQIYFSPLFENKRLQKDSLYINNQDSFQISQCKFYISNVSFKLNNKTVYREKNSFHLIEVFNTSSKYFSLKVNTRIDFNAIEFNLGIDSLTNSKGISIGALDPLKGMYWAWHSGYINFKLEGKSNLCKNRNQNFQFHLGGFRQGFYNMQTVNISTKKTSLLKINIDVFKFLSAIDLEKENHVMTPSNAAVELARKAAKIFSLSAKHVE